MNKTQIGVRVALGPRATIVLKGLPKHHRGARFIKGITGSFVKATDRLTRILVCCRQNGKLVQILSSSCSLGEAVLKAKNDKVLAVVKSLEKSELLVRRYPTGESRA